MQSFSRGFSRAVRAALVASVLAAGTLAAVPVAVAEGDHQRGPDPTEQSIEAPRGPFDVATLVVTRAEAEGFGGGTVYYPTDTSEGTFGAVAVAPGYSSSQAAVAWLGPRLASQGFVVLTIDTISTADAPPRRGDQLRAALAQLADTAVADRIDPARLAVMGHSMGGGGSLEAAKDDPALRAAIPLAPWSADKTFPEVTTPTLVIGAEEDVIAPVRRHAERFYDTLPADGDKAYLELRDANHSAPTVPDTTIARYSIAWLKRYVDDDERYARFLCPPPVPDEVISEYRSSTC
ncbi:serine aminopeptidase domain-containing protein [Promicromonospora sp. NPDC050880]|uniref:poly(ethylene terephthalate) hydrolase family protein n=1 Tax=Promicromonospora sp. NPDC050880 TaxID=3364406 RepID=UPI00379B45B2